MPKHYNQYKVKSAAWKKAKREHDEAIRKRKAVSTRLMNIKTKSPVKKKTLTSLQKDIIKVRDPAAVAERKKIRERKYKEVEKKRSVVLVGEKQWEEWLKFSKRKRSDKKS